MKTYSIKKTRGLTIDEILKEIEKGGLFVTYGYCISIVAMTFRPTSSPHFIRSDEEPSKYRLKYTILSLIFGWWGLPWGPIYTIDMIRINLKNGGININEEVLQKINSQHSASNLKTILDCDLTITFDEHELTK
jgi:hypothetical protein